MSFLSIMYSVPSGFITLHGASSNVFLILPILFPIAIPSLLSEPLGSLYGTARLARLCFHVSLPSLTSLMFFNFTKMVCDIVLVRVTYIYLLSLSLLFNFCPPAGGLLLDYLYNNMNIFTCQVLFYIFSDKNQHTFPGNFLSSPERATFARDLDPPACTQRTTEGLFILPYPSLCVKQDSLCIKRSHYDAPSACLGDLVPLHCGLFWRIRCHSVRSGPILCTLFVRRGKLPLIYYSFYHLL